MSARTSLAYRLSPPQRVAWEVLKHEPRARVQGLIELDGPLDVKRLGAVVREITQRHEILRTLFQRRPGLAMPLQVVAPEHSSISNVTEVPGSTRSRRRAEVAVLNAEGLIPLVPDSEPPIRLRVVRRSPSSHAIIFTASCLSADGPGLQRFAEEVAAAYDQRVAGGEPLQYAAASEWLANPERGRDTIEATTRVLTLPCECEADGSGDELPDASIDVSLAPALAAGVRRAAAELGISEAAVMMTGWLVLLGRVSAESTLAIGVAASGRTDPDLQTAMGPLGGIVEVRADCSERRRLSELAREAHQLFEEAEADPFASIPQDALSLAAMPAFVFEWTSRVSCRARAGLRVRLRRVRRTGLGPCKLWLTAVRNEHGLSTEWHFNGRRFEWADVWRLASEYQAVLGSIVEQRAGAVGGVAVVSAGEQRRLRRFNATQVMSADDRMLPDQIAARARRHPGRPAVVCRGARVDYGELDRRANQLGNHLHRLGAGPDVLVGICLERTCELIVTLLGIWKAGAAYVPLDPNLPDARLNAILAQARPALVVTTEALAHRLVVHDSGAPTFVCVDRDREDIVRNATGAPPVVTLPESLAYVLFTSGSTGRPKGVAIEHRQLANYVAAIRRRLHVRPGTRWALASTIGADLGNTAIFPCLLTGGALHILASPQGVDDLRQYDEDRPFDVLKIAPSHLGALLAAPDGERLLPSQCLICGGEPLSTDLIERVHRIVPRCRLFNHYGPTEATVGVLVHALDDSIGSGSQAVPIGRPLANTQAHVLNAAFQPMPVESTGELYLGGAGIARGYHADPALTAERFLPDPFASSPGARLYKTGDLARRTVQGWVTFGGRADRQVKIRGFRVEPAEIESTLRRHHLVADALVVTRKRGSGDSELIAYVIPTVAAGDTVDAARSWLREQLPDYMLPRALVALQRWPLNENGKIDGRGLPDPPAAVTPAGDDVPQTDTERAIADVWRELLKIDRVGRLDNFFDVGGHSLLLVPVMVRLKRLTRRDLTILDLFKHPTVSALARLIADGRQELGPAALPGAHHATERQNAFAHLRSRRASS